MSTGDGVGTDTEETMADGNELDRTTAEEITSEKPSVAASRTSPDRTVFAERGNTDAWIATDLTVELER